jgi:ribosomal protein S18 acetylase RimI-like enzyme
MTSSAPVSDVAGLRPEPRYADRIVRFERSLADQLATQMATVPFGVARFCPDLPLVYDASGVEVTGHVAAGALLPTVERMFAEVRLQHRRVHTTIEGVARSVGPHLLDRGWSVDSLVYMVYDHRTPAAGPQRGFSTVDVDTWAPATRQFIADEEWGRDPAVQDDIVARDRRLVERINARFVLADDRSAGCHVYRHGGVAQIENVYVLSDARGRGVGRGLLATALHHCRGADVVFLVADAHDWPRHWYRRAGFRTVTSGWSWLRTPATGG